MNFATDPAQGPLPSSAYPVNGIEGQLNTTWTHHFATGCTAPNGPNSHETVGVKFLWDAGNDWIEIGDEKYPNYLNDGFGRVWEEWHIDPQAVQLELKGGTISTSSPLVGLNVGYVGTPTNHAWRMYYDLTGSYQAWSVADTVGSFPINATRGGGYNECSRWSTGDCNSNQAYINYRLPADGLWRARATHTVCDDRDSNLDTLAGVDFPNVKFGPEVDNNCYP